METGAHRTIFWPYVNFGNPFQSQNDKLPLGISYQWRRISLQVFHFLAIKLGIYQVSGVRTVCCVTSLASLMSDWASDPVTEREKRN